MLSCPTIKTPSPRFKLKAGAFNTLFSYLFPLLIIHLFLSINSKHFPTSPFSSCFLFSSKYCHLHLGALDSFFPDCSSLCWFLSSYESGINCTRCWGYKPSRNVPTFASSGVKSDQSAAQPGRWLVGYNGGRGEKHPILSWETEDNRQGVRDGVYVPFQISNGCLLLKSTWFTTILKNKLTGHHYGILVNQLIILETGK